MVGSLRLDEAALSFLNPRIAILDDGLPNHPVKGKHLPTLRLAQQAAIAGGIGFRNVELTASDRAGEQSKVQAEQPALVLIGKRRRLLCEERVGALGLPIVTQQSH